MADPHSKPGPGNSASTILMATILVGAVMIAAIGTLLPGWIGLTGTPALIIQLVFYAVAAIDVGLALWLRARLKKANQPPSQGGGTVRRQ
jgi:membrane protein implicated in regulation of membrane protease activity